MDKLKMHTPNRADDNFKKLAALFPNAVTETIDENGEIVRAIDKDILMQEISCKVVEGKEERYTVSWPNKREAILNANAPISMTLRPVRSESVDFDSTENLYIEGDNLDVLKIIHETYLHKIKMIFIDPPYNTGKDFIYEDCFEMSNEHFLSVSGQYNEDGYRMVQNTQSNGRFHTDWLNMMYSRLKISRDLLTEDGSIFIAIDDNEYANLKRICDEIFGESAFVATIIWENFYGRSNAAAISPAHNYILTYAMNGENWKYTRNLLDRSEDSASKYKNPDNDPKGPWRLGPIFASGERHEGLMYTVTTPAGKKVSPPKGSHWRMLEKDFWKMVDEGRIIFGKTGDSAPATKLYLSEVQSGLVPRTIWLSNEVGHTQEGKREIQALFPENVPFDTPKPTRLLKQLIQIATNDNDIIMDYFSGSASTADAVMQLNAQEKGHRKFLMVQIPEEFEGEYVSDKPKNICEIGKERIRRAGRKIKEETPLNTKELDVGFRVLKCDTSNMKDVYYSPSDYEADLFDFMTDNIKEDRTPEDLLFQVMLDLGVTLSSKIEETVIADKKVFNVADGFLIACFDANVTDETIKAIAQKQPYYFVMRDSSLANDSVATNFEQIFATYSPDTVRKVL